MNFDFSAKPAVVATAVFVFVAASLYVVVDSPDEVQTLNRATIEAQTMSDDTNDPKALSVTSLIGGLEAKLAENPEDAKGWLLLAKSHDHLGDPRAAWAAYTRAKELGMSDDTFEIQLTANMSPLISKN